MDLPIKELKGFAKVFLKKDEAKTVEIALTPRDFAYYDVEMAAFRAEVGEYRLLVGPSSSDIRVRACTRVASLSPEN